MDTLRTSIDHALSDLVAHIEATYNDKYHGSGIVDPSQVIRHPKFSMGYNLGNALKYIQRYSTEGYDKSRNPKDLLKAIHYLLFEYANHRRS